MLPALGVTMPQMIPIKCRLAGAIGPRERKDLVAAYLEIDVPEGPEARCVDLGKIRDRADRLHDRNNSPLAAIF
jgi:hypothetical protein